MALLLYGIPLLSHTSCQQQQRVPLDRLDAHLATQRSAWQHNIVPDGKRNLSLRTSQGPGPSASTTPSTKRSMKLALFTVLTGWGFRPLVAR